MRGGADAGRSHCSNIGEQTLSDDLHLLDRLPASCVTVNAVNEELRAGISAYDELERAVDAIELRNDHERQ